MTRWLDAASLPTRLLLALALAGLVPAVAWACSVEGPAEVRGPLGFEYAPSDAVLLANAASVRQHDSFWREFSPVEGVTFYRVPEGATEVEVDGRTLTVGAIEDTTAPSRPEILDARLRITEGDTSCGAECTDTLATTIIDVSATDDLASVEQLTYLVYRRPSPALGGPSVQATVLADQSDYYGGALWLWADVDDEGAEQWVWVRAVDQAGNVSELSEPFPVDTGRAGACSISRHGAAGFALPLLLALALVCRRG